MPIETVNDLRDAFIRVYNKAPVDAFNFNNEPKVKKIRPKSRILTYLEDHYPCEALPYGTLTTVGSIFGVSRERVRQVARQNGFAGSNRKSTGHILCPECGKPKSNKTFREDKISKQRCKDCQTIGIACKNCGKLVPTKESEYISHLNKQVETNWGKYTGDKFCDRRCMGLYRARTVGFGQKISDEDVLAELTTPKMVRDFSFDVSRTTVVYHLKKLRDQGLVQSVIVKGRGGPEVWSRVNAVD